MPETKPTTVDEHIEAAPEPAQEHLRELRSILRDVAPEAKEAIKWGSPALQENRILFSYSAHKAHPNFMPTGPALVPFEEELASYKRGRDTIQFPYEKPLPEDVNRRIASYRLKQVRENDARWMY